MGIIYFLTEIHSVSLALGGVLVAIISLLLSSKKTSKEVDQAVFERLEEENRKLKKLLNDKLPNPTEAEIELARLKKENRKLKELVNDMAGIKPLPEEDSCPTKAEMELARRADEAKQGDKGVRPITVPYPKAKSS